MPKFNLKWVKDTDITAAELETLSDGSNADSLHVHSPTTTAIAQYRNNTAQDLNQSGYTSVYWDIEDFKDSGFTHSTSTNRERCYINEIGTYYISYNLVFAVSGGGWWGGNVSLRSVATLNGAYILASIAYCANTTDYGVLVCPGIFLTTSSIDSYIEIKTQGLSGTGNADIIQTLSTVVMYKVIR